MYSNGDRRPTRRQPATVWGSPLRWLAGLGPLRSWLVVMGVIVGLSLLGLRTLAFVVAVCWTGYAIYTWLTPAFRRRLHAFARRRP